MVWRLSHSGGVVFAGTLALAVPACNGESSPSGCILKGVHHPEGSAWREDCNTCSCVDSGSVCTLLDCSYSPPGTGGGGGVSGEGAGGGLVGSGGLSAGTGAGTTGGVGGGASGANATGGSPATNGGSSTAGSAGAVISAGESGDGGGGVAPTCPDASSLKDASSCFGRLVGVALSSQHLAESDYATAALEFNYVTPENEMKWDNTEPTRDQFSYDAADQVVDFATTNGMSLKGHTLVWYNQLPSWVSAITDADDLRSAMTNHIQQVMAHYQGKVLAWDVVNEAWDPTDPTILRDSVFTRVLGPSYIDDAFAAARAADPDAKLYYNDYGTDGLGTKSNSVYEMVKSMKERNVPIDGVGLQMHWRSVGSTLAPADVAQNIQRLGDLGLEVVISEMDVQLCKGGTLEDQQARFHDIVAACMSQPACKAVTFWGITDKYSWLNDLDLGCTDTEKPAPLLWDDEYAKKSAYSGVMDALLGR